MTADVHCRLCHAPLTETLVDLGMTPLANSYLPIETHEQQEPFYPLHARVCSSCYLVQLPAVQTSAHIFSDYAYFSSYSTSWLAHAKAYTEKMTQHLGLTKDSFVVEVASNDGYLLQYFTQNSIPVLGVEPAANVAAVARTKGVPTEVVFWGKETAQRLVKEHRPADLIAANNVMAHVPDVNDFVAGFREMLAKDGTITVEFPWLVNLLRYNQFDTIYHEHFSYFSLYTASALFERQGLKLYDVEELPTHGGSLRIYGCHAAAAKPKSAALLALEQQERAFGINTLAAYQGFAAKVRHVKTGLRRFFLDAASAGKTVAGYGAPAKGNTLLNACGISKDDILFTVDQSPHKQNHVLPGTHIPIFAPEKLRVAKPDYVLILPWNLEAEITAKHSYIREWGGRFVVPIPEVVVRDAA